MNALMLLCLGAALITPTTPDVDKGCALSQEYIPQLELVIEEKLEKHPQSITQDKWGKLFPYIPWPETETKLNEGNRNSPKTQEFKDFLNGLFIGGRYEYGESHA